MRHRMWQALIGLLLLLCSCRNQEGDGRPVIAVGFESQKWLVEQIAGDGCEVVALLPQGSDPEMFDPDMRTMKALERADAYLTTSTLGFETQVGDRIKANYPDLRTFDLTDGIEVLMHTHGIAGASDHGHSNCEECHDHDHGHAHGNEAHPVGDPHLLSSIANARTVARNILAALSTLHPEQSEEYCRRFSTLDDALARREHQTDSMLDASGTRGCTFVVMHPSLSYYARDYGMTQIPLEVDGKEASPRQLEERLGIASRSNPRALFYEEGHSEEQARELARSLGIGAYPVRLNGPDFLDGIDAVTGNLSKQDN